MSETNEREVVYWSVDPKATELTHEDPGEAVEAWVEDQHPTPVANLPKAVTVYGYARMELPPVERIAESLLDHLLEWMDEEYSSPGESTTPSIAMHYAAMTFAKVFRAEYTPWACEEVTNVTLRVAECIPEEWLATPTPEVRDAR